jgi:predicted nucleic acid-binding protein
MRTQWFWMMRPPDTWAEQEGCVVVGLLGLLIDAKRRNLVPVVRPLLDRMRQANFYIADRLYEAILRQAEEDPHR